jgi:SAM-dependent methyltransferase
MLQRLVRAWRRRRSRRNWERAWRRDNFAPPWLGRGISREIIAAVNEGWLLCGLPALDIGCGQGEVVAWLAERGFPTLGIDIAEAAIERARKRFGESAGVREFRQLDICAAAPTALNASSSSFTNLIDRGCFHQIPDADLPAYARNIARAASLDARLLLFVKAFRDGQVSEEARAAERARHRERVEYTFDRSFVIERIADTFLDPYEGRIADAQLPGLVFWMHRR